MYILCQTTGHCCGNPDFCDEEELDNIRNANTDSFMYGARQMHQYVTQDKGMQRGVSKDRNTEGSDWQGRDWSWEQPSWEELWSWEELPIPTFSRAFLPAYIIGV